MISTIIHLMYGPKGNSLFCFFESPDVSRNIRTHRGKHQDSRTITAQLYLGRDTFDFDQGYLTKNQPITVLVLLSESLGV